MDLEDDCSSEVEVAHTGSADQCEPCLAAEARIDGTDTGNTGCHTGLACHWLVNDVVLRSSLGQKRRGGCSDNESGRKKSHISSRAPEASLGIKAIAAACLTSLANTITEIISIKA